MVQPVRHSQPQMFGGGGFNSYNAHDAVSSWWWSGWRGIVTTSFSWRHQPGHGFLYLAGVVYVRGHDPRGMCYYPMFNNGVNGKFCRTEASQNAAMIFFAHNMVVYFVGAGVCMKLWRHEAARLRREAQGTRGGSTQPSVRREERDQYKAVSKDQYAEYKELHAEVQVLSKKFEEMDEMMRSLPPRPSSQMTKVRLQSILCSCCQDPTFLEKMERQSILRTKLSHIKLKINEYNKVMDWNDGFS
ncbi:hypothetical protein DPEC_G00368240 [Dallia pectoralis]|nr:hypothetical protein DPEC_G00368240 [Dallia pectoralis]